MASLPNGQPKANGVTVPVINGHKRSGSTSYSKKHEIPAHFIGGNYLEVAPAGPVKDFVAAHDGHTVITSVGQIAGEKWPPGQLLTGTGFDCQQWYCGSQGDPVSSEMGLRDLRR
jgi:hypothetical protein